MTTLTIPVVVVILIGMLSGRGYGLALGLGGITAAGAAFYAGDVALPTFYAVALGTVVILAADLLQPDRPRKPIPPGVPLLLAMLAWCAFSTAIAPFLFPGLETVTPARTILEPGAVTSSNIAQITYLTLEVCVVVVLARDPRATVGIIGLAVGSGVVLSLWRYGYTEFHVPFPDGLFDNSPTFHYIETAPGDIQRFRGIFSEPAALAGTCLIAIAYGVSRAWQVRGLRRVAVLGMVSIAIFLGVVSTSTTFLVAGVALVAIVGVTFLFGFVSRVTRLSALLGVAACLLIVLMVVLLPVAANFVQSAVEEKVGGDSYDARSGADSALYLDFLQTWGFGVGLGSGRASSLIPTILSTAGLLGTLLFVAVVVGLMSRAAPLRSVRPALWALVAVLTAKAISGPDLSDSTGVLWMALGLMSGAVLRQERVSPELTTRALQPVPLLPSPAAWTRLRGRS